MIVVEGPDGSGKTTLAKWIAESYDLEYRRAPTLSSEKGPDEAAIMWFEEQMEEGGKGGVYDRLFCISELIYRPTRAGTNIARDSEYMIHSIQSVWRAVDLLIFCLPPWPTARQNLADIGRLMLQGVDQLALEKIHWAYECHCELYKAAMFERVTRYDYTRMSHRHIREAIVELGAIAR